MAKKNEAEKTLADLQAQELKLRSTIASLEKDLAEPDFSNVDKAHIFGMLTVNHILTTLAHGDL